MLQNLPGLKANNFNIFKQYVPVAPVNDAGTIPVCAVVTNKGVCPNNAFLSIPIGNVNFAAPNYSVNKNWILNLDYNQSEKTQHRGRYIDNDYNVIDTGAFLPEFFVLTPIKNKLFSYTLLHTFTPKLTNETRIAYRRVSRPSRSQRA